MNLTAASIRYNRVTAVALLAIVFGGLWSYLGLPQAEDPGFIVRTAAVVTVFPGASPERVELLVTDKIEEQVQQIPELDFVTSTSRTGTSVVYVNIKESEQNLRPIWDDLRRKMERAADDLPDGVIGPDVNDEFGDVFGVVLAMTGEGYTYAELKEAADRVRDELLRLDMVAKVTIQGDQEERIFVEFSNARLSELGLSPNQLAGILSSQNIVIPGGEVYVGTERIALEPSGNFETVDELRRTVVTLPGRSDVLYLQDIARVERGYVDPPQGTMRYNGQPALGLSVSLREGGNIVVLGEQVRELMGRLEALHPIGLDLHLVAFQPTEVSKRVDDFVGNLAQSVGLVATVMLLFLGIRTGLVVASLIPTTIAFTFLWMSTFSIGIDTVSLAALIIALGMLVDNAIVMSESILVSMQAGKPARDAAVDSARELAGPLLTSSLTTAAAFLPIYLAENATGEYTAPLFKVVTIALGSSWLLALTLIPLLSVWFIRVSGAADGGASFDTPFYVRYRATLVGLARRPWASIAGMGALFVVTMWAGGFVPNIFFPPSDRQVVIAELELAPGTRIAETEQVVDELDAHIRDALLVGADRTDGVTHWASFVGEGAPKFALSYNTPAARTNYAVVLAEVSSFESIQAVRSALETFSADRFPHVIDRIGPLELGPPVGKPIQVRISGRDTDVLFGIVDGLKAQLAAIGGVRNVTDNWGVRTKKLRVEVDQPRARLAGVSSQDIATSLLTNLTGIETTQFREGTSVIPVMLRSVAADRQDIGKLEVLNVHSQATGNAVPMKQVADVHLDWEAGKVLRRDRSRTVTVEADLGPGASAAEVNAAILPWLEAQREGWDIGYDFAVGGEAEASAESNAAIGAKLPIAGLIIVLLLVLQFNSIRRPAIVLATLPLGLIGVIGGLLVTGSYFGFMTLLGIIALCGIIINNAVVLLDRIRIEIDDNGLAPDQAVVEAAQRRLRPILLTTATTISGLLPLWLGGGPMWEPMAIGIIFGLAFGTVLTLLFVPVLYGVLFRVRFTADSVTIQRTNAPG